MPVMSEGIMSGVNWMRLKERLEDPGDGADEQGLGQAGHAHEQDVSAGKESDQELFNHEILADDRLADLVANLPVSLGKLLSGDQVAAASLRCFCRDHANTSIRAAGNPHGTIHRPKLTCHMAPVKCYGHSSGRVPERRHCTGIAVAIYSK